MRRLIILIGIMLLSINLFAPGNRAVCTILIDSPIQPYEKLIYAVGMVESSCNPLAYNAEENAVGYFQIRPIRLRDYNNRVGSNYALTDMYDFDKALEVFMFYVTPDMESSAKNWNASKTETYWNKIKSKL